MIDPVDCEHPKIIVPFDAEAAKGLTAAEVRKRWPRVRGRCPDCGWEGTAYANSEHYIAGDW